MYQLMQIRRKQNELNVTSTGAAVKYKGIKSLLLQFIGR